MVLEFADRADAGRRLAEALLPLAEDDPIVVGLPRGGVVVAAEVARLLDAPLDVIVVRKLPFPHSPEVAMGAVGEEGVRVVDEPFVAAVGVSAEQVKTAEQHERETIERRVRRIRATHPQPDLRGRKVIVVDDGLATGATARAACRVVRLRGAADVILAVPVASPDVLRGFPDADRALALVAPSNFSAVGNHYGRFDQTSDDEVDALLDAAAARLGD